MRIKMWHKKDWRDIGFLTLIVLFPVVYDWIENSEVPWHLIALWFAITGLLFIPKQFLSYAYESNDGKVVLKESLFGQRMTIDRNTISTVELYEVDRSPIGLSIKCKDDSVITFVPMSVDFELLQRIRALIQKSKI